MTVDAGEQHIMRNYEAFRNMTFPEDQTGKFALLRNEQLVEVIDGWTAAVKRGEALFSDGLFSIQEISPYPARLGVLPRTGRKIAPERAQELESELDAALSGQSDVWQIG